MSISVPQNLTAQRAAGHLPVQVAEANQTINGVKFGPDDASQTARLALATSGDLTKPDKQKIADWAKLVGNQSGGQKTVQAYIDKLAENHPIFARSLAATSAKYRKPNIPTADILGIPFGKDPASKAAQSLLLAETKPNANTADLVTQWAQNLLGKGPKGQQVVQQYFSRIKEAYPDVYDSVATSLVLQARSRGPDIRKEVGDPRGGTPI